MMGSPHHIPMHMMRHSSSGSGEFSIPSPMIPIPAQHSPDQGPVNYGYNMPPQQQHNAMQGQNCVPPDVIEKIRQEAQNQAHSALEHEKAQCHRQVHLARVRIAELEERVQKSDAENDDMLTKLTILELENQAVKKESASKSIPTEPKASTTEDEVGALEKVRRLEAALEQHQDDQKELAGMKKIVMVLAGELKKRMAEGQEKKGGVDDMAILEAANAAEVAHVEQHLQWLSTTGKLPSNLHQRSNFPSEDTDYGDSRDHSDDSE